MVKQLAVIAHCCGDGGGVACQRAFPLEGVSQQRLGLAQMPGAQLQCAGVAEHDLRIQAVTQSQCAVDRARLAVGGERLVEPVRGRPA